MTWDISGAFDMPLHVAVIRLLLDAIHYNIISSRIMWVRLPLRVLVILFVGLSSLLLLHVPQVPQEPTCPHSHHFFWVITESRLHLVNRVALESIFLHHPTVTLSHWRTILFLPLL